MTKDEALATLHSYAQDFYGSLAAKERIKDYKSRGMGYNILQETAWRLPYNVRMLRKWGMKWSEAEEELLE